MPNDWDNPRPPSPRVVRNTKDAALRANIQRLRGILDDMEESLLQEPPLMIKVSGSLTSAQAQLFREAAARGDLPPPDADGITPLPPSVRVARKWPWQREFWRW